MSVKKNEPKKLGFPEVYEVPGGFRKLREACKKKNQPISAKIHGNGDLVMTKKPKFLTTKKATTISM